MKLEAFGRMLVLKEHFCNEKRIFAVTCLNPNPTLKDATIELYLTNSEWKVLSDLKMVKILRVKVLIRV